MKFAGFLRIYLKYFVSGLSVVWLIIHSLAKPIARTIKVIYSIVKASR